MGRTPFVPIELMAMRFRWRYLETIPVSLEFRRKGRVGNIIFIINTSLFIKMVTMREIT